MFNGFAEAIQAMQSWAFLIAFALGCINGIIFGVLPGLSGSVGIALMIPFTYGMGATESMALFVAALSGQTFAGSVSAILLNTPGTSPNAATTFDGYPLARQGRGGFAIGISATASFMGTIVGVIVLILLFPVMRGIILSFSFPEFTMLGVLGLAAIAVAARGSMLKGVLSGLIGLLVSFVGFAPIGGDVRYVFDQPMLFDGISVVSVLIGLFAISEALRLLMSNQSVAQNIDQLRFGRSQVWEGVRYTLGQPMLVLRSSLLGTVIGIIPAVGGTLASFLAYFQAAKTVKNPKFGTGDPRGVVAPEASNDAKDAAAALPSLAFGIPGSADWAIILGAMIIHGVQPGPNLIRESPDLVWVAIIVIAGASLLSSLIGLIAAPKLIQVTRVRPGLLAPIILTLSVTGAFGLEARPLDVLVAIGFGILAYSMRSIGMPVIPLILGVILGPMIERSFMQTLSTFGSGFAFFTRPLSLVLVILSLGIVVYEVISARRSRRLTPVAFEDGVKSATRPASVLIISGIAVTSVVAIVLALDFKEESRLFPIIVASLMLALSAAYLAVAKIPTLRSRFGGIIADGGGMEQMAAVKPDESLSKSEAESESSSVSTATIPEVETDSGRKKLWTSIWLLVALALGTLVFGLPVTAPIVLVLFFKLVGRETWRLTAILSTVTIAVLYVMFVIILKMPLDGGLWLTY